MEIPRRDSLKSLAAAANESARISALGLARVLTDATVSVLYTHQLGLGEWLLPADLLPAALNPSTDGLAQVDRAALEANGTRAAEAFLLDNQARCLVSTKIAGVDPATRLWVALADPQPPSPDLLSRIEGLAPVAAAVLKEPLSQDARLERLNRLEQVAELIPALRHVIDVRDVIDRLSATAMRALPHDLLILDLFSDDLSTATVYARSEKGTEPGVVVPNPYPISTIQAGTFVIVDDHKRHPMERESPGTSGARSSLRVPIRFDDRVSGGITFLSFTPHAFSDDDVAIGLRLSAHVASAISHFRMAERLAEQARRTQELQARTTNLELLDELLAELTDDGGIQESFDRISSIARKVLPHDGLALPVFLPDGLHARRYAAVGMGPTLPELIDLPVEFLNPEWEYDLIDDVTMVAGGHNQRVVALGFLSVLRMPIRLDGKAAAALVFLAKARGAFTQDHILVARRIVDRLAVALARDHTLEAGRRAAEAIERAMRLEARVKSLTQELNAQTGYRRVVGESASWKQALTQATQVAATETTTLLLGESGTGKEVLARLIHRASTRSHGPFIAINCAALPEQLLEAELFGFERGAFTGATQSKPGQLEQAAGGTLFLDEVGEMSLQAQAKFLRVLQEKEFQRLGGTRVLRADARIVAATNRDLSKAIANAQFREDLFYRLNVFAIRLPALRERRDDILPLTDAFLKELGGSFASPPSGISRDARQRLLSYHWPGNIRELRNILERAAILCDGGLITHEHLALPMADPVATQPRSASDAATPQTQARDLEPDSRDLRSIEKTMIEEALQNARFNKSKAAQQLGLTRHQLYIRMRRHGIAE